MIDDVYKKAFKEVYYILQNTEDELIEKVPQKFINFLQTNMDKNYQINISTNIEINKQKLLPETEDILSLIFRSYWATDEEKYNFLLKDQQENSKNEKNKNVEYVGKDIYKVFEERKKISKITANNDLIVIKKENIIRIFFNKLLHIFKQKS